MGEVVQFRPRAPEVIWACDKCHRVFSFRDREAANYERFLHEVVDLHYHRKEPEHDGQPA